MVNAIYENNELKISFDTQLNERLISKIKIRLSLIKNITYSFNQNILRVHFNDENQNIIFIDANKIITGIEKIINVKIALDDKTKSSLRESNQNKDDFFIRLDKLKELKKGKALQDDESFLNFKSFCDSTLLCKLRPYQYEAAYFLTLGNGGFDFSVPGSGKTIIAYAAYNYLKHIKQCDKILIIGPINSFNAWKDEYITCFGKQPNIENLAEMFYGFSHLYFSNSGFAHKEITFINNDKVHRLTQEIINFVKNKKVLLIVDEAHKEKNPNAKITIAVKEISKYVKSRIILTGTPMPNGYEDLDSLCYIYSPFYKILPYKYYDLKNITKSGATPEQVSTIMNCLKPVFSRVSKKYLIKTKEILPSNENRIYCEMSSDQKKIYDFLDKLNFKIENTIDYEINTSLIKAILIRKMQISANPGLLTNSIIDTIDEYKDEYVENFDVEKKSIDDLQKADKYIQSQIINSSVLPIIKKFSHDSLEIPKNSYAVSLALDIVKKGKKVIL